MKTNTLYYLVLCMPLLVGCNRLQTQQDTQSSQPLPVEVLTVSNASVADERTYVGEICPQAEYNIFYAPGGQLQRLYVHNGDRVMRGQLLAEVDSTQATAVYSAALAALHQAEDAYERVQSLWEDSLVSDMEWVDLQTKVERARQSVTAARKAVRDCRLTAPEAGLIDHLEANEGQQLLPGQTLCKLRDVREWEAQFSVPEQDISGITVGNPAQVLIAATDATCPARISSIGATANPVAHTYPVRVHITNATGTLLSGMSCRVRLTGQAQSHIVVVPGNSVQTTPEGPAVWVVPEGSDSVCHRPITIHRYVANGVEVSSGLSPGDRVVISGYHKLYQGAQVAVK